MSEYSDVPQINALYNEQQAVQSAINIIDAGGTMSTFSITPAPPNPDDPPPMGMAMTVTITLPNPATPETMAAIREQLVIRDNDITTQLDALGVTNTPPVRR